MKIACTGIRPGKVAKELIKRGVHFISADITKEQDIQYAIRAVDPDVIIHTAGMTNVDACEERIQEAFKVNAVGVENIISWWEGKFIYLSTDHVFHGMKWLGSGYTEKHEPSPVNAYGLTKMAGETIALSGASNSRVIRTSKLFSEETLWDYIELLKNPPAKLVYSGLLKRSYLYIPHFVTGLLEYVKKFDILPDILPDVMNLSGTSVLSEADFMKFVCRVWGYDETNISVRRTQLKGATPRPLRAGLSSSLAKTLGIPLYSALDGLREMYENSDN